MGIHRKLWKLLGKPDLKVYIQVISLLLKCLPEKHDLVPHLLKLIEKLIQMPTDETDGSKASRVLHDIAPANSEEDAIRLFARIQRQIGENPRGSGIIIAAGHLDGAHSHVHIVHDCNWNSTSCSDVFMRGVAIKKREKGRFGRWANELAAKFWENLLYYLFGRGRRY